MSLRDHTKVGNVGAVGRRLGTAAWRLLPSQPLFRVGFVTGLFLIPVISVATVAVALLTWFSGGQLYSTGTLMNDSLSGMHTLDATQLDPNSGIQGAPPPYVEQGEVLREDVTTPLGESYVEQGEGLGEDVTIAPGESELVVIEMETDEDGIWYIVDEDGAWYVVFPMVAINSIEEQSPPDVQSPPPYEVEEHQVDPISPGDQVHPEDPVHSTDPIDEGASYEIEDRPLEL